MIHIRFPEPSCDGWRKWRERCRLATDKLVEDRANGIAAKCNDSLYKEMKRVYLSEDGPFHGKCAYCESFFAADQPGDIDHFRPKAEVRDILDQLVTVMDHRGKPIVHPGYYWLAYDWRNLLPSCRDCNTQSKWKTKGQLVGKGCRFPVKGVHTASPGMEGEEEPLLINPAGDEDPSTHLEIDGLGVIISKTDRGDACRKVFGLNDREALVRKRREAFEDAGEAVMALFDAARTQEEDRVKKNFGKLQAFEEGRAAYAAAGRAGMKLKLPEVYAIAVWLSKTYERFSKPKPKPQSSVKSDSQETNSVNMQVGAVRVVLCEGCGERVPDVYVQKLVARGEISFDCPCGHKVGLT